jgi:hypothetical protein
MSTWPPGQRRSRCAAGDTAPIHMKFDSKHATHLHSDMVKVCLRSAPGVVALGRRVPGIQNTAHARPNQHADTLLRFDGYALITYDKRLHSPSGTASWHRNAHLDTAARSRGL